MGDTLGHFGLLGVGLAIGPHRTACVHKVVHRNSTALGDLVIVEIMRARDFHGTRSECRIRIFIGNDRDQSAMLFWTNRYFT